MWPGHGHSSNAHVSTSRLPSAHGRALKTKPRLARLGFEELSNFPMFVRLLAVSPG